MASMPARRRRIRRSTAGVGSSADENPRDVGRERVGTICDAGVRRRLHGENAVPLQPRRMLMPFVNLFIRI